MFETVQGRKGKYYSHVIPVLSDMWQEYSEAVYSTATSSLYPVYFDKPHDFSGVGEFTFHLLLNNADSFWINHLLFYSFADGWLMCFLPFDIFLCVSCVMESLCLHPITKRAVIGMDVMDLFRWIIELLTSNSSHISDKHFEDLCETSVSHKCGIAAKTWHIFWHPSLACFCGAAEGQMETLELKPDSVCLCAAGRSGVIWPRRRGTTAPKSMRTSPLANWGEEAATVLSMN